MTLNNLHVDLIKVYFTEHHFLFSPAFVVKYFSKYHLDRENEKAISNGAVKCHRWYCRLYGNALVDIFVKAIRLVLIRSIYNAF